MLQLRCPSCRKKMLYHSVKKTKEEPSKKCVYCGRSFTVKKHIIKMINARTLPNNKEQLLFVSYGRVRGEQSVDPDSQV